MNTIALVAALALTAQAGKPASGRISGKPFTVEKATIKEGILELRQGKEFFADLGLTIFLFLEEGEVPAGRTFKVTPKSGFGSPHIHMKWKAGRSIPETEIFIDKYAMTLAFGREKAGKLPGTIQLQLPDPGKSTVAGTFEAEIQGYRLINGKPDLTADSFKLFKVLAIQHLQKAHRTRNVKIEESRGGTYSHASPGGPPQHGFSEYDYTAGGRKGTVRLQFLKDAKKGWKIHATLRKDQVASAHPVHPVDLAKPGSATLQYLAAVRIEEEHAEAHPGKGLTLRDWRTSYNRSKGFGQVSCKVVVEGDTTEHPRSFLVGVVDGKWAIKRALAPDERVDYRTGEVRKGGGK